jgi:hypothetical protein
MVPITVLRGLHTILAYFSRKLPPDIPFNGHLAVDLTPDKTITLERVVPNAG